MQPTFEFQISAATILLLLPALALGSFNDRESVWQTFPIEAEAAEAGGRNFERK